MAPPRLSHNSEDPERCGVRRRTHRRAERPPQKRSKPRALQATQPNQVYCWGITYLPTQVRREYFYLYLFEDLFSRKIVGWQVFDSESAEQASQLLQDICTRLKIGPAQLTVHSDNGSPMKGETMLATMQRLGVAHTRSRPAVSNDNPYVESIFRTLKYRPQLPVKPFADLLAARRWMTALAGWYNDEHRHSDWLHHASATACRTGPSDAQTACPSVCLGTPKPP